MILILSQVVMPVLPRMARKTSCVLGRYAAFLVRAGLALAIISRAI